MCSEMTKSAKELIITVCLLPVLALVVMNSLKQARGTSEGEPEPLVATPPEESGGEEVTGEDTEPALNSVPEEDLNKQRERLSMEWGRDPFSGVSGQGGNDEQKPEHYVDGRTEELSEVYLTAISWMPENPVALINRQAVSEGEFLLGYEIVEIQRDRVILRKDNKKHVLTLEE